MDIVDIANNIIYSDLQALLNERIKDSTTHHDKINIENSSAQRGAPLPGYFRNIQRAAEFRHAHSHSLLPVARRNSQGLCQHTG